MKARLPFILTILICIVPSCSARASGKLKAHDSIRLALIKHLAQEPRRLNPEYLRYVFGMPEVSDKQIAILDREFDWRTPGTNQSLCQLSQQSDRKTGEFVSNFSLPIPSDSKIDFPAIQSLFDVKPIRNFNQKSFPTMVYQISPTTQVVASKPHSTATLDKVEIKYKGPPLGAPTVQDLNDVKRSTRDAALVDRGEANQTETIPLLAAWLHEFPDDAEVRIRLAEVYKSRGSLSEAIVQYRLALSQVGTNQELKARCLEGLQDMKVINSNTPPIQSNPTPAKLDSLNMGF